MGRLGGGGFFVGVAVGVTGVGVIGVGVTDGVDVDVGVPVGVAVGIAVVVLVTGIGPSSPPKITGPKTSLS